MAKIGTAHIEIKPVLDEAALSALTQRIEDAVAAGVIRGMAKRPSDFACTVTGCADRVNHRHPSAQTEGN